ncbi:hypothetical protein GCM10011578_045850 [Streptomyces fuscichromogenes]|uniref:Uncharacterized protein n=1 Tax=Streptomyces fuscichromogenes TaxID=1324013 RepID=A0A917XEP0_9ACTN|nr:hypothetical protein GCM10011578_045850 [Streptomyces fuscichromogenes]
MERQAVLCPQLTVEETQRPQDGRGLLPGGVRRTAVDHLRPQGWILRPRVRDRTLTTASRSAPIAHRVDGRPSDQDTARSPARAGRCPGVPVSRSPDVPM